MTKENFWHCVHATINSNVWDYKDAYIKEGQKVDDPFVSSIKYVAEKLAQIKGLDTQEVIDVTNQNARRLLFGE